jgi:SAM-dependent methyltransferase
MVRANADQIARLRETVDPEDFYAPLASSFRPGGYPATELPRLREIARPTDTWLDVGAGAGRLAVPLAGVVRAVVAVEPSAAMRGTLAKAADTACRDNIRVVSGSWPGTAATLRRADVTLAAYVLFDQAEVLPFIDALEWLARRRCVVTLTDRAPSSGDDDIWREVHGEEQARLPALREFIEVLAELGRAATATSFPMETPVPASFDEALEGARRTYWVRPGTEADQRLERLVRERFTTRSGRVRLPPRTAMVTVVDWAPR